MLALFQGKERSRTEAALRALEEGKNVQVIMCSSGTACEVAANFVVEAAESVGWTADIIDGQFNPEVWLTAFDTAISKKPDAIIGIAIPDVAVDAKLKAARDAGIVTVSIADTPQGNTTNPYDAYVSYRMPLMHQVLAYATIAETDGAANIILINDSAFPNLVESNVQFSRVLGQCSGCSVTQVDWTTGDALDPVKTDAVVTAALAANPNANYVVLPYSIGMASAIEAVRKAGKSETVKVVAKDGDAFALGLVAKGDSPFNAGVGLDWVAYAGIDQVARGLAGDAYVDGESTGLGIHLWTTADSQADGSSDYTQWLDFKAQYKTLWGVG
jgi:ABC-type sugar transport system substrate-binding protein